MQVVHLKAPLPRSTSGAPVYTYCGWPGESTNDADKVTCQPCLNEWKKYAPIDI